ncbi:MAG: uroporphyrinogen-III synthase [Nitrososphaerota archaeon]|nr:uroporphyrinogen-III synthase [Nitrososphaerota archaeon]
MKGRREVVVARTKEGNAEFQRMLSRHGIDAAAVEAIEFQDPGSWAEVDSAIAGISRFDWVAFTSPRGVVTFGRRLRALGMEAKGLGPKFAAVGPSTATALGGIGIEAEYVPSKFQTSALGEGLPGGVGSRVLLLRADIGEKRLVATLQGRGFQVEDVSAYGTRFVSGPVEPELVREAKVVAFASPSEVEGFRRRLAGAEFRDLAARATAACIGPVTALAAREAGFRSVVFPQEHTVDALAEKIGEMMVNA